jgi:two-component system, chemotaxis family, sensor kinase CheA
MIRLTNTSSEEFAMSIDIDPLLMQQLLETFRLELEERIQIITEALLSLEKDISATDQKQLLEEMFRAAHNIKGASRGIGLENTAKLAHRMESLFTALQRGESHIQSGLVDICLLGLDTLRNLLDIEGQDNVPGEEFEELLQLLQMAIEGDLPTEQQLLVQKSQSVSSSAVVSTKISNDIAAESIRLPVQRLDRIATLVNELQISQLRVEQHQLDGRKIADLSQQLRRYWVKMMSSNLSPSRWAFSEGADLVLELNDLCQNMDVGIRSTHSLLKPLTSSLRDDVHELRLIPAETILNPLKLVVRDVAQAENKKVELVLDGAHLEMDRVILEKIRDPLVHLLRNAVDHGIETPDVRTKAGKDEIGHINISLEREGNNVYLSIKDDGAGIDLQSIKNKILKLELASQQEVNEMSETELADFIFRTGFSSRDKISEISGRGVGLDVVRSNLQMLKGSVSVSFTEQYGSHFLLTIPFTMGSEHGLFVRCSDQTFAIPAQYIKRIMEITSADIINLESKQAILIDSKPVALQMLSNLLQLPENKMPMDEFYQLVVIHSGWKQMALIVDSIVGEQEMVIKSLYPPLDNLANISGGTLGNDGNIILVLDILDLLGQKPNTVVLSSRRNKIINQKTKKILVVDDSITTRTLEVSILQRQGYNVQAVVNAEEALAKLQTEHFDLLITDVEMPGMNGFELTDQLRTHLNLEKLPVIIVTSLASEADRRRGLEVKADAYIVKSDFESTELLNIVAQLI